MKVAYFTESLLPLVDGVSLTLARLFDTLELNDVDFRIYSPFQPPDSISWSGRVRPVRFFRFPLYPDYRVSIPSFKKLQVDLDAFAPDLIHVVSPTPTAVRAQRYARQRGIPVVSSFHTHFVSYFRFYHVGWLESGGWRFLRWFYGRCDRVFAPSRSIIDELASHGIHNVDLWSRGIDPTSFSPEHRDSALRTELGASDDAPILLMVSRLVKEKDLGDLVAIERHLHERGVPHRMVLVGDGPLRSSLEKALPNAHFAGHLTGADLARWYASADVFVFPSTTETLGNVVLEALASGLPTVVTDRGGPQDLISEGETGFITPGNDTGVMADRLEELLRDADLRKRMGDRARESAHERSWTAINKGLISSYQAVMSQADSR